MQRRSLRRRSLQIWLSDDEYRAFKEIAQGMSLSVSGLGRVCILAGLRTLGEMADELRKSLSEADLLSLSPSPSRPSPRRHKKSPTR